MEQKRSRQCVHACSISIQCLFVPHVSKWVSVEQTVHGKFFLTRAVASLDGWLLVGNQQMLVLAPKVLQAVCYAYTRATSTLYTVLCLTLTEPEVYRPPSLGVSPSYGVNQRSCWGKKRVEVPQFHHHFAVEARCAYERIKFEGDTIQVSIRGDSFEVNKQLLMEFITEFQVLSNLEKQKHGSISDGGYMSLSQGALLQEEQTKTALAVRAIDRFLFPNNELKLKGGCYHQLSSRVITSKPESPDVMVVGLNHDCCPTFPVLYGDWKNEQFEKAVVESCLYAITGMESQQKSIVFLGLPYAFSEIALKVYVGYEQKVLEMDICSCSVKREVDDEVKRFFCTLYGCVHSLIVSPIRSQYQSVDPFCCDGDHHVLSHRHMERRHLFSYFSQSSHGIHLPRVIHCVEENVVRKYYDSSFHRELNIDANVKYILNATTEKLNDQVTVLKYPFLPGGHEPQSIEHIVSVIFKLNAIHSDGFVHSDIRKENLIFGPDNVSYIIDFDLTAKEEELYPPSYFSLGIQERHCDACASQKRFKNHDRWSLHKIIINAQMELTTYQEECIEELLNDTSLDNIAGRLRH